MNCESQLITVLDLFSGIGGNTLALQGVTKTIAYCEVDKHAQAVLKSRMADGLLTEAPIFSDVTLLKGSDVGPVDMIVGGFPCQDISVAGKGAGITEETRSGLFYEIMRLTDEIKPRFLFLENVSAIKTNGLNIVLREITARGYDCRWTMLSAAQVGARHKRERWFLLADSHQRGLPATRPEQSTARFTREGQDVPNADSKGLQGRSSSGHTCSEGTNTEQLTTRCNQSDDRWATQPRLGGMVNGFSDWMDESLPDYLGANYWQEESHPRVTQEREQRVERIKRLGNAVVPLQARTAFLYLSNLKQF